MLERGICLAPSQFETMFVSPAHTRTETETTLSAASAVLEQTRAA
jgi:glutamate-1-semialdehyde aminotransferase